MTNMNYKNQGERKTYNKNWASNRKHIDVVLLLIQWEKKKIYRQRWLNFQWNEKMVCTRFVEIIRLVNGREYTQNTRALTLPSFIRCFSSISLPFPNTEKKTIPFTSTTIHTNSMAECIFNYNIFYPFRAFKLCIDYDFDNDSFILLKINSLTSPRNGIRFFRVWIIAAACQYAMGNGLGRQCVMWIVSDSTANWIQMQGAKRFSLLFFQWKIDVLRALDTANMKIVAFDYANE